MSSVHFTFQLVHVQARKEKALPVVRNWPLAHRNTCLPASRQCSGFSPDCSVMLLLKSPWQKAEQCYLLWCVLGSAVLWYLAWKFFLQIFYYYIWVLCMSQRGIFAALWQIQVLLPSERWRSSPPDHAMSLVPRCLRRLQEKGTWHRNVGSLTERQNSPICLFKVVFFYCLRERRLHPESLGTAYTLRRVAQEDSFPQQCWPQRPLLPCTAYGAGSQGFAPGFLFPFFILFKGSGSRFLVFPLLPMFVSGTLCWQLPQQPAVTPAGGEAADAQKMTALTGSCHLLCSLSSCRAVPCVPLKLGSWALSWCFASRAATAKFCLPWAVQPEQGIVSILCLFP